MGEEVGDKRHTQLYEEVTVHVHLGMGQRVRKADRHEEREGFT